MSATLPITADQFSSMSFDVPVELVRGEIVEMTVPGGWHGAVCFNTALIIGTWIRGGGRFLATSNDAGVLTEREPDTVRGPDLLIIRRDRLPAGKIPQNHFEIPPDVAVEVKSPSDRWSEIILKAGEFLHIGTGEVWVIDPEHRRIHVFRTDNEPTIFNEGETISSSRLPGFSAPVAEFFEGI